jgi:hypothetical protein
MPAAITAAVMSIGQQMLAAKVFSLAVVSWGTVALSVGLSLVSESLNKANKSSQSPFSSDIATRKQLIRASSEPRRVIYGGARVSGTLAYVANGTNKDYVHFVIPVATHSCEAIDEIWLGDEKLPARDAAGNVTTGRFAGHVRVRVYLGDQTTGDTDLSAECPDWGAKPRPGRGLTWVYLRLKRSRDVFPQGIPTPRFDVRGKNDILDIRTGLRGYTDNAALCTLDWILWRRGFNSSLDEVEETSWIAAANASDEDVAVPGGGTQKRYRINGSFTLGRPRAEILDGMRQAMAGMATYIMGLWHGGAGVAEAAVMDIDERDLRGPYRVRPRVPDDKVYNAVRGTYTETGLWTETDFPPVTNPLYEAQDGGERLYKDVELPFEIDPYRAQRLAKCDLERHRQGMVVEWPMRIRGLALRPWNIVRLTVAKMGWDHKPFRVVDYKFNLVGGPDLVLEEYAPTIYSMSVADLVTADPAPDTALASPYEVATPGALTLSSGTPELIKLADGTVISRIRVMWPAPGDAYVRGAELQYRVVGATEWQPGPPVPDAAARLAFVGPVVDGAQYELRLRFENTLGVRSDWRTSDPHTVVGQRELPANIPWATISGDTISWGLVAGADITGYQWRIVAGYSRDWGVATPLHDGVLTASPWPLPSPPAGQVTLLGKAVDASGNKSAVPVAIMCNLGDALVENIVETVDFAALGWPGDLVGGAFEQGTGDLVADSSGASFYSSNPAASMYPEDGTASMFPPTISSAMTWTSPWVTLPPDTRMLIDATITGVAPRIEYRTDSTGPMFPVDGTAPAFPESGSAYPAPGPWTPFPGGGVPVPGVAVQLRASTEFGTVEGRIAALTLIADAPDIEETIDDFTLAAEGSRLPITRGYRAIKNVQLTLQASGGGAVRLETQDKNPVLGPLVRGFDSADAGAGGLIDARIKGY